MSGFVVVNSLSLIIIIKLKLKIIDVKIKTVKMDCVYGCIDKLLCSNEILVIIYTINIKRLFRWIG